MEFKLLRNFEAKMLKGHKHYSHPLQQQKNKREIQELVAKARRKAGKYPRFKDKAKKKKHKAQIKSQHINERDGHPVQSSPASLHSKLHPFQHFGLLVFDLLQEIWNQGIWTVFKMI